MASPNNPQWMARAFTRRGATHAVNDDRYAMYDGRIAAVREARRGALYALADGVSSTSKGFRAAEATCEALAEFFVTSRPVSDDLLLDLVETADAQVRLTTGAACTLALLWLDGRDGCVVNAGDTAIFRYRRGKMTRLTPAQTRGGGLSTYIGMGPTVRHTTWLERIDVAPHDVFVLATDGVLRVVKESQLAEALEIHASIDAMLEMAWTELQRLGHPDDATMIAVDVGEPDEAPLLGGLPGSEG